MYDKVVDVPRLLSFYDEDEPLPDPALDDARARSTSTTRAELGEPFRTAGLCFYRDGRDSVAWHGDTHRPGRTEDTMVAIVSVGDAARRCCCGRAAAARRSATTLGHGDLIVMGGSCQRTWEHAIPKTARPTGPRISVQFRPRGRALSAICQRLNGKLSARGRGHACRVSGPFRVAAARPAPPPGGAPGGCRAGTRRGR